ncbi:MAG: alpha/beta hydrolase [Bryobacterales bacterium]|nr:alpha/beta hydrolase [Bryobacterales bacterium]
MPAANINGALLRYEETGEGEALILVHGSASDMRTWHPQLQEFGKFYRTISYSRRYHWPNEPIREGVDYAMAEHVHDLQTVVEALHAIPAHLVGHSYGAFLSLLVAIHSPKIVRSLVLAEPPAITLFVSNRPRPVELLRLLLRRPRTAAAILKFGVRGVAPAEAAARRNDMEEVLRLFETATLGAVAYHRLPEARREQARANLIKAELLEPGFAQLDDDSVRRVQSPVLLVTGQKSPPIWHHISKRLEILIPNMERVEIKQASHIMHEDNPQDYNTAVLSFLAKHSFRQI